MGSERLGKAITTNEHLYGRHRGMMADVCLCRQLRRESYAHDAPGIARNKMTVQRVLSPGDGQKNDGPMNACTMPAKCAAVFDRNKIF